MKVVIVIGKEIPEEKLSICEDNIFRFPETMKHPKEQVEWVQGFVESLEEDDKEEYIIQTFSDYIIRELSYYLVRGVLKKEEVAIIDQGVELEVSEEGTVCESIDKVIDSQNQRLEDAYYQMKYGE